VLALGGERARDDLVGGVIAAHGVDGQHRTGHRPPGPGHGRIPGPPSTPRAATAVGPARFRAHIRTRFRALGSAYFRAHFLALLRPGRGPPLRAGRCRAQRVTGLSGRG
jgi:hypothetical protein